MLGKYVMQLYKVWRRGFQFTALSIPAAAVLAIQDVMPLCPVARHPIDHTTTRVLHYMCFVPQQHPLQTSVKYRAVFLYVSTYAYSASTGYLRLCLHMASNKPLHQDSSLATVKAMTLKGYRMRGVTVTQSSCGAKGRHCLELHC